MPATSLPEPGSVTAGGAEDLALGQRPQPALLLLLVPNAAMPAPTSPDGIETSVPRIWQTLLISSISSTKVTKSRPQPAVLGSTTPPKRPSSAIVVEQIAWKLLFAVVVGDPRGDLPGGELGDCRQRAFFSGMPTAATRPRFQ